jgi:hypothetical protein
MGQPMQLNSPLNELARAQGVRNMMQTNELNAMQAQDMHAQRAAQAQRAQQMQQALANLPPPPPDAPQELHLAHRAVVSGLMAPKEYFDLVMKPKPDRKLTVVGKTAIDPNTGQPVYSEPAAPEKPTSAVQEYEYAKAQGYQGSFKDWTTEKARAGASSTSVSYGAPVAGVDADGKPVFFQPDKKGGNPAIIPGVAPPKPQTPAAMQEKLAQNAVTLSKIDKALEMVEAKPDSLGLKNYAGDAVMQRLDPAGVEVRAMIADIGGQKIHDRSGAAVTVGEAERLKPYIPAATDTPDTAKKKLKLFRQEYAAMQQAINSGASIAQAASRQSAPSTGGVVNFSDLK